MINQDPEQRAHDNIDKQLNVCGWVIQDKKQMNLNAALGVAVRKYNTQDGKELDYALFVEGKPVGVIEAKAEDRGYQLIQAETQSKDYADSKLKHLNNEPLPFVFESTGVLTRFTDYRDPKPRSRSVFTFHRPETFREWLKQAVSLRRSVFDIPPLNRKGFGIARSLPSTSLKIPSAAINPRPLFRWPLVQERLLQPLEQTQAQRNLAPREKFRRALAKVHL